jgi:hypothetical protein
LQGLYQLLQDGSGHEEWIALWIDAIIRDATAKPLARMALECRIAACGATVWIAVIARGLA